MPALKRCSRNWRNYLLLIAFILFSLAKLSSVRNNHRRFTHGPFDQFDQSGLSVFVESVKVVSPECGCIDKMRPDNGVHLIICKLNLRMSLQL